jgi:hypothetical protein
MSVTTSAKPRSAAPGRLKGSAGGVGLLVMRGVGLLAIRGGNVDR